MSAIILVGGVSKRFGKDKGLVKLANKSLVLHVLDKLTPLVDDMIIVANSEDQKQKFGEVVKHKARIITDNNNVRTPLAGASAGFKVAKNEYTLLLACDTPFISSEILSFLLEVSINKAAAIPRWPNSNIEPLQAAYHAKTAAEAASTALDNGERDMNSMISKMRSIRYISTLVLEQLNPKLTTFFNINTPNDLRKAEAMIKRHAY